MSIPIQMRPIYGELSEMISDYCDMKTWLLGAQRP